MKNMSAEDKLMRYLLNESKRVDPAFAKEFGREGWDQQNNDDEFEGISFGEPYDDGETDDEDTIDIECEEVDSEGFNELLSTDTRPKRSKPRYVAPKTLFDDYGYDYNEPWLSEIMKQPTPDRRVTNRQKAKKAHLEKARNKEIAKFNGELDAIVIKMEMATQKINLIRSMLAGEEDIADVDKLSELFDMEILNGKYTVEDVRKSLIQMYGYRTKQERELNRQIKDYVYKTIEEKTNLINERRVRISAGPRNYKKKKIASIDEKIRRCEAELSIIKAKCPELVPDLERYDFKESIPINEELKARKDAAREERYRRKMVSQAREYILTYKVVGAELLSIDPPRPSVMVPGIEKLATGIPYIDNGKIQKKVDVKEDLDRMREMRRFHEEHKEEVEDEDDESSFGDNIKKKIKKIKKKTKKFCKKHVKEIVAGLVIGAMTFVTAFLKSSDSDS